MPSPVSAAPASADVSFDSLGVPAPLVRVLADRGITTAFPIQAATLRDTLAGKDRDQANVALHRVLARDAGPTLEWLRSLGVQFVGPFPEPPNRAPR